MSSANWSWALFCMVPTEKQTSWVENSYWSCLRKRAAACLAKLAPVISCVSADLRRPGKQRHHCQLLWEFIYNWAWEERDCSCISSNIRRTPNRSTTKPDKKKCHSHTCETIPKTLRKARVLDNGHDDLETQQYLIHLQALEKIPCLPCVYCDEFCFLNNPQSRITN